MKIGMQARLIYRLTHNTYFARSVFSSLIDFFLICERKGEKRMLVPSIGRFKEIRRYNTKLLSQNNCRVWSLQNICNKDASSTAYLLIIN